MILFGPFRLAAAAFWDHRQSVGGALHADGLFGRRSGCADSSSSSSQSSAASIGAEPRRPSSGLRARTRRALAKSSRPRGTRFHDPARRSFVSPSISRISIATAGLAQRGTGAHFAARAAPNERRNERGSLRAAGNDRLASSCCSSSPALNYTQQTSLFAFAPNGAPFARSLTLSRVFSASAASWRRRQ